MAATLTAFMAGSAFAGWQSYINGWWYRYDNGGYAANEWLNAGAWYHFDNAGYMQTGWLCDGAWYYMNGDGSMHTGWLFDGNTWYYLNASGAMVTGRVTIDGTVNIFDGSGAWLGYESEELNSNNAAYKNDYNNYDSAASADSYNFRSENQTSDPGTGSAANTENDSGLEAVNRQQGSAASDRYTNTGAAPYTGYTSDSASKSSDDSVQNQETQGTSAEAAAGNTSQQVASVESTHTHTWTPVYVTVHHEAVTHQEPVYDSIWHMDWFEEGAVYGYEQKYVEFIHCNSCGQNFYGEDQVTAYYNHTQGVNGCPGGYLVDYHYEDDLTKPLRESIYHSGYYEDVIVDYKTVIDEAAWDEQVIDHYECACGAIK